jgi:O-antigen/teichoic acid export membrane protein
MAQPGTPSLRTGALQVLIGNGTFNACRLAAVVLLAKKTSAEIVGQYETGLAIATPVLLFFGLELRTVFVASADDRIPLSAFRRLRRLGSLLAGAVLAGVVAWRATSDAPAMAALLAGACALRAALQAAELDWGVFQRSERLDWLGTSNALRGVLMLVAFAGFATAGPAAGWSGAARAAAAVWTSAAAWVGVALLFDRPRLRRLVGAERPPRTDDLRRTVIDSLPLTLVALLISLCDSVPRLVVRGDADGLRALGYFGAISYVPMIAHFVILQIGLAASRRLAVNYTTDPPAFRRLAQRLTAIAVGLGAAVFLTAYLLGPLLLEALYTPDYAAHFPAFLTLVGAQCLLLLASIWGYVLTQTRRFWRQVPFHIAVVTATAIAAFLLIPSRPVEGAAQTMLVRSGLHAAIYGVALWLVMRRSSAAAKGAGQV